MVKNHKRWNKSIHWSNLRFLETPQESKEKNKPNENLMRRRKFRLKQLFIRRDLHNNRIKTTKGTRVKLKNETFCTERIKISPRKN